MRVLIGVDNGQLEFESLVGAAPLSDQQQQPPLQNDTPAPDTSGQGSKRKRRNREEDLEPEETNNK